VPSSEVTFTGFSLDFPFSGSSERYTSLLVSRPTLAFGKRLPVFLSIERLLLSSSFLDHFHTVLHFQPKNFRLFHRSSETFPFSSLALMFFFFFCCCGTSGPPLRFVVPEEGLFFIQNVWGQRDPFLCFIGRGIL